MTACGTATCNGTASIDRGCPRTFQLNYESKVFIYQHWGLADAWLNGARRLTWLVSRTSVAFPHRLRSAHITYRKCCLPIYCITGYAHFRQMSMFAMRIACSTHAHEQCVRSSTSGARRASRTFNCVVAHVLPRRRCMLGTHSLTCACAQGQISTSVPAGVHCSSSVLPRAHKHRGPSVMRVCPSTGL